jgi:hypothetical protein
MLLTPERRATLLADTKECAAALVDDLSHLRALIANSTQLGADLRRSSGVLRRLLVERDIADVASPRIGRILFEMPDNQPYYDASRNAPFTFFSSGGMTVFGVNFRATVFDGIGQRRPTISMVNPHRTARARLDGFLTQRVLCLNGMWVNRGNVIKHIAHFASGVHSGSSSLPEDEALSRIRRAVWFARDSDSQLSITFDTHALLQIADPPFRYAPDSIDPVLVELLAAATYLLQSADVSRLENLIREELR